MPTTVKIPLTPLTVEISSANCFYTTKSGANCDEAHFAYVDGGVGKAYFYSYIPWNLAATPAWNVDLISTVDSGSGGNVVVNVLASAKSDTSTIDVANTLVSSAAVLAVNNATFTLPTAISGGNFDSVVGLSAGNYAIVEIQRLGNHASDNLSAQWNLKSAVLRLDVA